MPQNIILTDELFEQIKKLADQTNKTVDAMAESLLTQALPSSPSSSKKVYSKEDEEKVKERLRGLGYLD